MEGDWRFRYTGGIEQERGNIPKGRRERAHLAAKSGNKTAVTVNETKKKQQGRKGEVI